MTIKMTALAAVAVVGGFAISVGTSRDADAQARRGAAGYVQTCSQYGNGCTKAPVRRGRNGYEYRMPGGTWIRCRGSCRNSLREDSVDFWETQRENQRD